MTQLENFMQSYVNKTQYIEHVWTDINKKKTKILIFSQTDYEKAGISGRYLEC